MPAMKELVKGTDRYRHFINGEWVDSTVKEWIEVENPATQAVIASVPKRWRGRCRPRACRGACGPTWLGGYATGSTGSAAERPCPS